MDTDSEQGLDAEELDLESGEEEDLESAMRDALEAVERPPRAEETVPEAESDGDSGDELAMLQREVAELRDRSVRTLADFDNYRKRVEREREEQRRYAGADILREMLGIIDNLERALRSEGDLDGLRAGVELISREMNDFLRRKGVERVAAEGHPFDPTVHDAVSREEDSDVAVPTVRQELQAGYVMNERLLRPATVVVAVPPLVEDEG